MLSIRTPLRERCNVQLKVWTAIPTKLSDDSPSSDEDDDVFFGGRLLYRRGFNAPNKMTFDIAGPALHPLNRLTARGLLSVYKLVPDIFLALHTGKRLPSSLTTEHGAAFTHIIHIAHPTSTREAGGIHLHLDANRGLHILTLPVPPSSPVTGPTAARGRSRKVTSSGTGTSLTENQLLAARDFLSLALPYFSEAHPPDDLPVDASLGDDDDDDDDVRVLVTAPVGDGAARNVMSAVLCYLTYTSRKDTETVVGCIKAERGVPVVWRDGMQREGLGFIERVATMGE